MRDSHLTPQVPYQPNNPSDNERYALAHYALTQRGRPEDLSYIISSLAPLKDITYIGRPGKFKNIKVGIIGGGLAGLSTAYELRKLGFDITILEALEDRIGGRVYTYYFDKEKTLYGEMGAMRIPVTHEAVWHYINLFKLNTRPFIQTNENAFIYLRDVRVRNDLHGYNVMKYIYPKYCLNQWERRTPWRELVSYGLDNLLQKAAPAVRAEILKVLPQYSRETLFWDASNTRQVLELSGLSEDGISLVSSLAPLAGGFLYNSYIDFVQEDYSADLAFLYEIPGGAFNLPNAFYNSFNQKMPKEYFGIPPELLGNVSFKAGCWVTGIHQCMEDGNVLLTYRKNDSSNTISEKFDYVVCAIPFSTLRTMNVEPLFSPMKMKAIKEVNYGDAQKTAFLCKHRFWEEGGIHQRILGGGSYTDLPVTTVWYPSDHASSISKGNASEPGVMLASYNFNLDTVRLANLPEELRFEEIKRELEEVQGLPKNYLESVVSDFKTVHWNDEPTFRGALCFYTPEQKRIFSYVSALPEYNGRVFFAGEHISAKHRWMQGALKSGMQAAEALTMCCRKHMYI